MSNQISSKSNVRVVLAILFLMAGIGSSARAADGTFSQTRQQMAGLIAKAAAGENIFNVTGPSDTIFSVTQTGNYRITVRGADGGDGRFETGGSGASIAATFALQAGDVLTLVTGLVGSASRFASGGGGGSAVILTRGGVSSLLLVAGAGGGTDESFVGSFGGGGGDSAQGIAGGGAGNGGGGGGNNNNNSNNGMISIIMLQRCAPPQRCGSQQRPCGWRPANTMCARC